MYKKETISAYVEAAKQAIREWEAENTITVSISKGNRKIGRVMNVSIMSIITCKNCTGCMWYCYDVKSAIQYGNVMQARARNTALVNVNRDEYFRQIDKAMSRRRKNKYFRWHVGGEIPDYDYFCRMVDNAWKHPEFTSIWTYTKQYFIIAEYIRTHGNSKEKAFPKNFHVMLSEWRGMEMYNPYNLPTFRCVFDDEKQPVNVWWCPGNCDICKECNRGCVVGESTCAHDH